MGAWGTGVFENDDARDWVYELVETDDATLLVETLETVTESGDEYIEAPECCRALAAAQVVVALGGGATPVLDEDCREWVQHHRDQWAPQLVPLSLKAIERIRTDSELQDLWDKSDDASGWYDVLRDLEVRLRGTLEQSAP